MSALTPPPALAHLHAQQQILVGQGARLSSQPCSPDALLTLRSPEMLAPARMPVAEGKKMENIPKKLPSGPRQSGTKF